MIALKTLRTTAAAGLLLLGSVAGFSTDAYAASANSVATINWGSLSISFLGDIDLGDGPAIDQLDTLSDTTLANAFANGVNPIVSAGPNTTLDWDNGSFAQAETGNDHYNGNSTAETPNSTPGSNFKSESQVFSDRQGWIVDVNSKALRSGEFTAIGEGFVLVTVGYSLFAEASDGGVLLPGDTASASARVSALLRNLTSGASAVTSSDAGITVGFGENLADDGLIGVLLYFHNGDRGHLDISALSSASTSSSPVPLPAAGWLLGGALMMMAARRRRV